MPECKELTPQVLGRSVEDLGFESVFYPEHTHIPVNTRRGDGGSARDYANTYDPFVALAAVAAVTSTLKLGLAQTRSATTSAGTGRRQRSRHRRSGAGLRRRVAPAGGLLRYSRRLRQASSRAPAARRRRGTRTDTDHPVQRHAGSRGARRICRRGRGPLPIHPGHRTCGRSSVHIGRMGQARSALRQCQGFARAAGPMLSDGSDSSPRRPFQPRLTRCAATSSRLGLRTSSHHWPVSATIPTSICAYMPAS